MQHVSAAPYHPQSNGLAERAVRTVKKGLKKLKRGTLSTRLAQLLFRYRRTFLPNGASPFQKLLGYQLRARLDTCLLCPHRFPFSLQEPEKTDLTLGMVRGFGLEDKLLPGIVQDALGSRMVTVETPTVTILRHANQVRVRQLCQGQVVHRSHWSQKNLTFHLSLEILRNSLLYEDWQDRRNL